ncbi:MAG: alkaline ceramidase [Actinobacteria bacterium]|nr:alkaline ceramidase [Actinomycetota bacterium]
MSSLEVTPFEGQALIGIMKREITPPFGIYGRVWGASNHDKSEGSHKPLFVTAMSMQTESDDMPALLVAIDAGSLGDLDGREGEQLRESVRTALQIDDAHLMIACSHTHASPWFARSRSALPGGDLIERYLEEIATAIIDACKEALAHRVTSIVTFSAGKCALASNRDLIDPHNPDRFLTGFNPAVEADDTLMVGRIVRISDGETIGTLVNYACHPTSLGWGNKLISPDYVGAMREKIESETGGVPCLFLQGASGDLGPAYQYVAETDIADAHGKQLAYSSLSALTAMYPAGNKFAFIRSVESGAPLGYWEPVPYEVPKELLVSADRVSLPAKVWPSVAELDSQIAVTADSFAKERLFRKRSIAKLMLTGGELGLTIYGWRLGKILFVGVQCEVYSIWQQDLREMFPDYAIVAITCVDYEAIGYVVPDELHDLNLYQAWQPPFDKGVMGALFAGSCQQIRKILS